MQNVGTRHCRVRKIYTNYTKMTKKLPQRKSPRAKWLDYNEGEYFVTICTHNWIHYFGEIADGEIHLSQIGLFLTECLENTKIHQPHINILQYVVMPNHFHAIIDIEKTTSCKRNTELQTAITLNIHCFFKVSRNKICPHNRQQIHMAKTISRPCHSWYRRPQQHITIHRKQYRKLGQRLF